MKLFYAFMLFILGSVLASFYGVLSTRGPVGESIVKPRSHCNKCKRVLHFYELIPILSYIFLGGQCKSCKTKLPIYEPISEIMLGLAFSLSYLYYGVSYEFFMALVLSSLALNIFISDFKYMIILDSPLVVSSILILIIRFIYQGYRGLLVSLGSGIFLFLLMLFIGFLGKKLFKRDALGGGDIKLSFVIGLSLASLSMPYVSYALIALIFSTFLALPYSFFSLSSEISREVPYGPFLISATCFVFVFLEKFSYLVNLFTI